MANGEGNPNLYVDEHYKRKDLWRNMNFVGKHITLHMCTCSIMMDLATLCACMRSRVNKRLVPCVYVCDPKMTDLYMPQTVTKACLLLAIPI